MNPPFSNFSSVVRLGPFTIACAAISGRDVGQLKDFKDRSNIFPSERVRKAPLNTSVECSHWLRNVVTYLNSYLSTRFPCQVVHDSFHRECLLQSVTEPDRYVLSTSRCSHKQCKHLKFGSVVKTLLLSAFLVLFQVPWQNLHRFGITNGSKREYGGMQRN